jgi:hypothetical protein
VDEELQELLDKQAINEVIQRISRTMDWLDDEGQASCYWPDAAIDFGFFVGRADAYVPFVMEHERKATKRWHLTSSASLKVNGDRAEAESYNITTGSVGSEINLMFGGRYLDEFEKRDGEWRISKRMYILDWMKPFEDQSAGARFEGGGMNTPDISEAGHELYRAL